MVWKSSDEVSQYLEDLPLDVVGAAIARTPIDEWIGRYQTSRGKK